MIPTNYTQLPIGRYLEILDSLKQGGTEIEKQVRTLSLLAGVSEDAILRLPIGEYTQLARAAAFLEEEIPTISIAKEYKLGGFQLVPTTDLRKITTAQYIDLQTYAHGADSAMVEITSCFLIPKGKQYNEGYDVVEVQKAIRENLSVADVHSLSAFFLDLYKKFILSSLTYSKRMSQRITNRAKKKIIEQRIKSLEMALKKNGDGLIQ